MQSRTRRDYVLRKRLKRGWKDKKHRSPTTWRGMDTPLFRRKKRGG